nr:MAG TPA: hypothetical protein [Bacteriophage sp.]
MNTNKPYFFRYHVITKCIYKAPEKGRKETL